MTKRKKKLKIKKKKNRSDKRHHALDAMVLTYAGEWMRDRERHREENDHEESDRKNKDILLYKSIDSEARASIVKQLEKLMPKTVVGAKPALGKTYYGLRKIVVGGKEEKKIVERKSLLNDKNEFFGLTNEQRKNILDGEVVKRLEEFEKDYLDIISNREKKEDLIKAFKEEFFSGKNGKRIVKKVMRKVGNPDSYKDIAPKGKKGQYVKDGSSSSQGTFNHGQFLAINTVNQKVEVFPVHAFDSPRKIKEKKIRSNADLELLFEGKLLKAGETILKLQKDFKYSKWDIPKGLYTLKSLKTEGVIAIESNRGVVHKNFQINDLYHETHLEIV